MVGICKTDNKKTTFNVKHQVDFQSFIDMDPTIYPLCIQL